jgi:hypothetical protein
MTALTVIFFLIFATCAGLAWGIPMILAFFLANVPDEKEVLDMDLKRAKLKQATINHELTTARMNKVKRDNEVLDSRQGKIENEILILEERLDKLRRDKGVPFEPYD